MNIYYVYYMHASQVSCVEGETHAHTPYMDLFFLLKRNDYSLKNAELYHRSAHTQLSKLVPIANLVH